MPSHKRTGVSSILFDIQGISEDAERQFILLLRNLLMPIVEAIQSTSAVNRPERLLELLLRCIEDLASGLVTRLQTRSSLSFREVSIALMIRHGWSSEDIAEYFKLTPETVKSHRRNIRKKLGVTGSQQSLRQHLHSLAFQDSASHVIS